MSKNKKPDLNVLIAMRLSRREVMQYSLSALIASALPSSLFADAILNQSVKQDLLGFKGIPIADLLDEVVVPKGYKSEVFYRWGDPISTGPEFKKDGSNTAKEQLMQAGMHHDAVQFYPLPHGESNSEHGLLVMNHEYIDARILHADGGALDSPDLGSEEKTLKEQYAHGVSVIEVGKEKSGWKIVRPSHYARRITATTPMSVSGPVAGSHYIQTKADPLGREILGTFNNCSNGMTPWGSYLTCEENFNDYFVRPTKKNLSKKQKKAFKRYNIKYSYYSWHKDDERFDASKHANEPNRFGWIVEFDPYDPESKPVKRTALGRFSHENVAHSLGKDGRLSFYSGDDAQFEYVYKFITENAWDGSQGIHNGQLLDKGILHAAQFDDDGKGQWLPLVFGQGELTPENGFKSQADILVHARMAADKVGATPMDRPEWVSVHPETSDVYVSMTNNTKRGDKNKPNSDAANPRDDNYFGHIIKIVEDDATSTKFEWDVFVLAGDEESKGTINGDVYANPDGLMIDSRGVLWVQTDISTSKLNSNNFAQFGNNQMLAIDPNSKETRRFLTGPIGCEITGVVMTPDLKTMWVNIQHPGEGLVPSHWPDHHVNGRPRSATVIITKEDGGVIGT